MDALYGYDWDDSEPMNQCTRRVLIEEGELCSAGNAKQIVSNICNDKVNCSVTASNRVFGDPCKDTRKYLRVNYTCVYSLTSPSIQPCETTTPSYANATLRLEGSIPGGTTYREQTTNFAESKSSGLKSPSLQLYEDATTPDANVTTQLEGNRQDGTTYPEQTTYFSESSLSGLTSFLLTLLYEDSATSESEVSSPLQGNLPHVTSQPEQYLDFSESKLSAFETLWPKAIGIISVIALMFSIAVIVKKKQAKNRKTAPTTNSGHFVYPRNEDRMYMYSLNNPNIIV
ncbi:D-galactoside-specific lectin [Holothuria leucospilota]|uniref:D-galactoside-specific lectin n=1 Tax=Holothuria leucospilota TaxID=206669 RepID=A0A9Q1CNU6_HOLLE|nr:D-galactoside-specific lectin [Holothuria leucospilota]